MLRVNGVENVKDISYGPLCFKRGDDFLTFTAVPVWSMEDFDRLNPVPENDNYFFGPDGKKTKDYDCSAWKDTEAEYWRRRWGYVILKSLEPSKIEIDGISIDDPATWGNVESALKSELTEYEFQHLMGLVDEANALDQRKLDANVATFMERQTAKNSLPENSSSSASAATSE
jgi:hypothetical protein